MSFRPNGTQPTPQSLAKKLHAENKLLSPFQDSHSRRSPPQKFVNMRALEPRSRTANIGGQPYGALPVAPRLEFIQTMPDFNDVVADHGMVPFQVPLTQDELLQPQINTSYMQSNELSYQAVQPGQYYGGQIGMTRPIQPEWQNGHGVHRLQNNQPLPWDSLFALPSDQHHLAQVSQPPNIQPVGNPYPMAQFHPQTRSLHGPGPPTLSNLGSAQPSTVFGPSTLVTSVQNPPAGFIYDSLPSGRVVMIPQNNINQANTNFVTQALNSPAVPPCGEVEGSEPTDVSDEDWDSAFDSDESDIESDEEENETKEEFKNRLTYNLKQMMFVSGETAEPSTETTWMIEEIVREQVVEMLKEATALANRRGSKSISIVDLIFQIRHNPAKVSRLKTFLSWKDVRKNVKDSDDKAGGADADALDLEDGALPGANPAAPQKTSANKKAKLILPWEVQSFYNETVPEREDEEDEEEEEQNEATLARLASADERTKNMTKDEYVYWSDCRQASFTFRKGKRFREWAGFGTIIDSKPNDDVVDILGFLTFEIVQTLTEEALRVKGAEDLANKKANGLRGDNEASKKRKREGCTLFEMPEEGRTPVEPKHVREAFRRLQIVPTKYKFMRQGYAGVRTPLRMI